MIRYGVVGYGRIGKRLAARLPGATAILARQGGASDVFCTTLDAFIARKPAVAVECASAQALAEHGPALLAAGIDLVPLSLTALADPDVEHRLMAAAKAGPGRLEIAPGAIGTLDLLASAREDGLTRCRLSPIEVARDGGSYAGSSTRRPGIDPRPAGLLPRQRTEAAAR